MAESHDHSEGEDGKKLVPLLQLLEQREREIDELRASTSWRVTAPLRRLLDWIRGR